MNLRRVFTSVVLVGGLLATTSAPAAAQTSLDPEFTQTSPLAGFFPTFTPELFASPSVGDVTGDGQPEVVVGAQDGRIRVYAATTGAPVATLATTNGAIQSAPTLVDLNGDGTLDILSGNVAGDIVGQTVGGTELFRKRTCTWPGKPCDVFGTIAAADIDLDGEVELITTSNDHYVHAWELTGAYLPGFPVRVSDTTWASPAIADLTGDGYPEIVVAVDVDYITAQYVGCRSFGARLLAIDHLGAIVWNRCLPGEIVMSSPAIGDIDADGAPEIVVGTGKYFGQIGESQAPGRLLHVFDAAGGSEPGWPQDLGSSSYMSPSIGQLDDDPQLEIAMPDDEGYLRVYEHHGVLKFRVCGVQNVAWCPAPAGAPASIADVDNDGRQEIITAYQNRVVVTDGRNGAVEADHVGQSGFFARGQVAVAEVGGVATIFRAVLQDGDSDGSISAGDTLVVDAHSTGSPLGSADWGAFRGNDQYTGSFETSWTATGEPSEQTYVTRYTESELADLDVAAAWLGMTRAEFQSAGLAVANFLRALTNADPFTVTDRPDVTTGTGIASTWAQADLVHVATMNEHFSVSSPESQKVGASLLVFLAGLDRMGSN